MARKDLETVLGLELGRGRRAHRKVETGKARSCVRVQGRYSTGLAAWLCCAVDFHFQSLIHFHTGRGERVIASCLLCATSRPSSRLSSIVLMMCRIKCNETLPPSFDASDDASCPSRSSAERVTRLPM
ncbi:hypothetical protein J3E68DRAFT_145353 [Trichoderma sp. SZMC 28012]